MGNTTHNMSSIGCCARKEKSPTRHSPGALAMRCPHDSHSLDQTETGSTFLPRLSQAASTSIGCSSTTQADTEHTRQTELLKYAVQALSPLKYSPIRRSLSDSAGISIPREERRRTSSRQQTDQQKAKA